MTKIINRKNIYYFGYFYYNKKQNIKIEKIYRKLVIINN